MAELGMVDSFQAVASETPMGRLEAAVEFLLINSLNAQASREIGVTGNRRLVKRFMDLLKALKPDVFLDIGAHDGSTAAAVKAMLPDCMVSAFEANPTIHKAFRERLVACGVTSMNMAVAARSGVATIYAPRTLSNAYIGGEIVPSPSVEPANSGKSSLLKRNEVATYDEFLVPAMSIDEIVRANPAKSAGGRDVALWIDVEGAAFEVLSGAATALERTCAVFIESENHEFWTDQKQCGDVARALIMAGFLPLERDREYADKQFNTVFLHHSLIGLVYPKTFSLETNDLSGAKAPQPTPQILPSGAAAGKIQASTGRSYHSLAACLMAEIPVFVPVFNNPTYASLMLHQLKQFGIRNIFLVDNASTYDGMARFLDQAEADATIIRASENKGPHDLFVSDTNYACLPDIFCVTDPDLAFHADMPRDFLFDLLNLTNTLGVGKAGLALDLSERDLMHDTPFTIGGRSYHIWEWEGQFWREQIDVLSDGSPVFKAPIDTTFAIYNKKYFKRESFYDAVRVAGRYTCRHMPWYKDTRIPPREEAFYKATQKFSYHMR